MSPYVESVNNGEDTIQNKGKTLILVITSNRGLC
jgi:F0F1-type ATP synthase gamma subunit